MRRGRLALVLCAVVAAALGVAHVRVARPLLARFASYSGCPVSLGGSDAVTLEAHRVRVARARAGIEPARSRPALAFQLGNAFRPAVAHWLEERHADCEPGNDAAVLRCRMPISEGGVEAHIQFDDHDRLVAVNLWHPASSALFAVTAMGERARALDESVGPATSRREELSPERLGARPLRRIAREYRYADYSARLSVTNLGTHGIRLREQYQWIPPT